MDEPTSAEIIMFPTRLGTPLPQPNVPPTERLSTALSALSAALAEQQQAIQRWRAAMTDLATCMRALGGDVAAAERAEQRV